MTWHFVCVDPTDDLALCAGTLRRCVKTSLNRDVLRLTGPDTIIRQRIPAVCDSNPIAVKLLVVARKLRSEIGDGSVVSILTCQPVQPGMHPSRAPFLTCDGRPPFSAAR